MRRAPLILLLLILTQTAGCSTDSPSDPTDGDSFGQPETESDREAESPAESETDPCPPGLIWNPSRGMCLPDETCPEGTLPDPEGGGCRPTDGDLDADLNPEGLPEGEEATPESDLEERPEADPEEEMGELPIHPYPCVEKGWTVRPYQEATPETSLFALAADFTLPTLIGNYRFKDQYSGCETTLVIPQVPRQTRGWSTEIWDREGDVADFIDRLPENTRVLFVPQTSKPERALTNVLALKEKVEAHLATLSEEKAAFWRSRLLYVTLRSADLDGWVGELLADPGWGFAIDRFQRIRYIGSFADPNRYSSSVGWFAPNLSMAANEPIYYNFESDRQDRLDADQAVVLTLFNGEVVSDPDWAGVRSTVDVTFPDAATMAGFDTLTLDLELGCVGEGEYGTCPAWDYIAELHLCEIADPTQCPVEFGRWITTYHRIGRWVHDVSALLPLLDAGGTRRFSFYSQQPYTVKLSMRLSRSGKTARPTQTLPLFGGGAFNADYNTGREEKSYEVPPGVAKVHLATVLTGHGMAMPGNCAEFCDTTHTFTVNGQDFVIGFPQAGTSFGCMDQVAEGSIPNQYGTWWYGRSGWCPGREVQVVLTDVTGVVTPGETMTVRYSGLYEGEPYTVSGAEIRLTSWVVFSDPVSDTPSRPVKNLTE